MPLSTALVIGALAAAGAAAAVDVTVTADLSGAGQVQQSFFMLDCVGASHGEMYMWEDNRNHLRAIARDIGFKHVRGHGLLNDDLSTYLNGRANMWNLHSIFDFLLSINMRPVFELSFTPAELASDPTDSLMHYRANASPAKDRNASAGHSWYDFIHDLTADLVDRYGIEEIRQWRFEHYNEPNCGFFHGTSTQWYEQYAAASAAIKSVDNLIQVGGPATCALGWLGSTAGNNFMQQVKTMGIATDIVTTHLYPTDDIVDKTLGRDGFSAVIKEAAANVTAFGYEGMPLVMTEFNAGLGLPTEVNGDTAYTAAMVLHNHLALQGVANLETLSFWSYSDIFEEGGMDSQPWHNGYGIMNVNGVPKPIYRLFEMLKALPASAVPVTAQVATPSDVIVPRVGSVSAGQVDVVVAVDASQHPLIHVTALMNNFDLYSLPVANKTVQVNFARLPAGAVVPNVATLDRIDSTHANPRAVWDAAGGPQYCSPTEIAAELAASQLVGEGLALTSNADGSLSALLTLEPFSVARIRFSYTVE